MSHSPDFVALQEASRDGDVCRVRVLLDRGVDQNIHPGMPRGWSPLMYAASRGHREIVQLLVERGADVNFECGDGFTAVTLTAKKRFWEVVKLLAEAGADVTHYDATGTSALHAAERANKVALVELFRRAGRRPA